MIFIAKNEDGKATYDLVLSKDKIVTRRKLGGRIYVVGKDYAVQRGRGKKQEGRIVILSRMSHLDWIRKESGTGLISVIGLPLLNKEAKREGFNSWKGLLDYLKKHNLHINDTIRYEFELID